MEKKMFKQITVNDIIYFIKKNTRLLENKDTYGNLYDANLVNKETVKRIDLTDNNTIVINRNSNRNDWFTLEVKEIDFGSCFIETKENIYFVNYSDYKKAISNLILNKITECKTSIIEYEKNKLNEINCLREAYYDYLNNTNEVLQNTDVNQQ